MTILKRLMVVVILSFFIAGIGACSSEEIKKANYKHEEWTGTSDSILTLKKTADGNYEASVALISWETKERKEEEKIVKNLGFKQTQFYTTNGKTRIIMRCVFFRHPIDLLIVIETEPEIFSEKIRVLWGVSDERIEGYRQLIFSKIS